MIPVYIGFDQREAGAFWTCASSLLRYSSKPVQIIPLVRKQLPIDRPIHSKQTNDFSFTRFLVPHLQNYTGHAIFVDGDFLFMSDIADLWYLRDGTKSVQVCQHPMETFKEGKKYLGSEQTVYPMKCWSSLMMFNCEHEETKNLTPDYVETASGLELHQFTWTHPDHIGKLPLEWNWLVGHYPYTENVRAVHYTEGGPYFKDYADCDYAVNWKREFQHMKYVQEGNT